MVTASGKKMSLKLFVLASMHLKRLPEGNKLKRLGEAGVHLVFKNV